MTAPDDAIEALIPAAATARPWMQAHHIDEPRAIVASARPMHSLLGLDRDGMAIFDSEADAALVVEAVNRFDDLVAEVTRLRALFDAGNVVDVGDLLARLRAATSYCEPGCTKPVKVTGGDLLDVIAALDQQQAELGAARTAEDLAATALGQENERLRAIAEGRECAPTNAECGAHGDAGGSWLVSFVIGPSRVVESVGVARKLARDSRAVRWLPLDAADRPCAWPATGGA